MNHTRFNARCLGIAFLLFAATPSWVPAQQPTEAPSNKPLVSAGTEEVVLDLIARDKKGRLVQDLQPGEVEIYDNGARKEIKSFRLIQGKEALEKNGSKQLNPLQQVRLVTMVFDSLGVDGRRFAKDAALDLLKTETGGNVFYGVYSIGNRLSALQPFTSDRDRLKQAVTRATSGTYRDFVSDSATIRQDLERQIGAPAGLNGQSQTEQVAAMQPQGHDPSQQLMAQIMLNTLQFEETMARDQQGRSTIYSLLALVREQFRLPGRKTLLYFSEGLQVPVSLADEFQAVIGAANRANVSVYAIDARGLLTTRGSAEAVAGLRGAAAASLATSTQTGQAVTREQVQSLDRAEQSIRNNRQTALAELGEETGGALIANSNDLRVPLRKVNEEINSYYEVTYDPHIENYDGKFRKISVKTDRADLRLQTRSGYFAIPASAGSVALPFEVPLLQILSQKPLPRNIEYRADVLHFQPSPKGVECALVVEVPMKGITFTKSADGATYKARLSMVALVKDSAGTVLQKFSKDLPLQGNTDKLAGVQAGNFIYRQSFVVPPGRYTVEAALIDRESEKASARKSSFFAKPSAANGIAMSSIAMVRRIEEQEGGDDSNDPFHFEGGKVMPTLAEDVHAGKGSKMMMFFVIYPDKAIADKPALTMEFLSEGKLLARATPELPGVDASGRIPYVATSSAEAMPPGRYELHAVVRQGNSATEERTAFTVE